jgi:isopenicillin N synthase-like dioxygenase
MAQVAKIPVIDITADGEDQIRVARELVEAAVEHGFIYVKNTGQDIPVDAVENAFNVVSLSILIMLSRVVMLMPVASKSRKLFGSPMEEKQRCKILQNNRGWVGMQYETLDPKHQRVSKPSARSSVIK